MLCFHHILPKKQKTNTGFSLVELSIVIIIIGLIMAIVTGGIKVRKAAEIRGFITDIQGYQVAIESFEMQYEDLPGDITDAHSYWDDGSNTVCGTATQCNGDGDGDIEFTNNQLDNEAYRAWQHLNLSGLMEGGYSGTGGNDGADNDQSNIGINIPAAKRAKVGYALNYTNTGVGNRNEIILAAFTSGGIINNAALEPKEANAIDRKIDDGNPTDGSIAAKEGADMSTAGEQCRDGAGTGYLLTYSDMSCIMAFTITP